MEFKIKKHIATITKTKHNTLELNYVSFDKRPAKLDLRRWGTGEDGERVPYKGIQLDELEFEELKKGMECI